VYGRADLAYVYSKSDFRKFQGIEHGQTGANGGPSRIGFRGEEGLGSGLKAIFNFEWATATDEGGGPAGARWAWVGLAGQFGQVTLGRNQTPSDLYTGGTSHNGISGIEPINVFRAKFGMDGTFADNATIATGSRWNNSIAYASPNFSGLDFTAIYSFGEKVNSNKDEDGQGYSCARGADRWEGGVYTQGERTCRESADTSDAGRLGLGVRYTNGPLDLAAIYEARADDDSVKGWNVNGDAGFGAKGWGVGGAYDFKVVKVYANYFRHKANHDGLAGLARQATGVDAGSDKQTTWSVGLGVPVSSAGTVTFEYAQYKDSLDDGLRAVVANLKGRNAGHKAKGYMVGYKHALSKRTSVYAYGTYFDNDRGIDAGFTKANLGSENQTNFVTGIVHVF
jgi:predicted porin